MTYKQLYQYGVQQLADAQIMEAELEARLLLEFVCRTDRNTLLVHGDSVRSEFEEQSYRMAVAQRALHIPLQHITGEQEFMGLSFRVNKNVLIPRQDTETLVEEAMCHLGDGMRILDLCTGCGCILLSLLKYSNECEGIGVDISPKALEVARENAIQLGLNAVFLEGDLFAPLADFQSEKTTDRFFDIIVSNPPYIETAVIDTLMPEVRDYEPRIALDGTEDGLFFYREIIRQAAAYMRIGAWILFEIGYNQGEAVKVLLEQEGFQEVSVVKDYTGLDRVVCGLRGK